MFKFKKILSVFLIISLCYVFDANGAPAATNQGVNSAMKDNITNNSQEVVAKPQPTMSRLNSIDNNADDLIQLKRKLEVEKAEAELKKVRNSSLITNSGNNRINENVQTTVTGVAINQEGKKMAWLQFADGSSLTVNIGSQVGKYTVTDITMTGVQLSFWTDKHHLKQQNTFLKRAYYASEKTKSGSSPFFVPSPATTTANSTNDIVPSIVSVGGR